MTWGEFKAAIESAGVLDSDGIGYIDVNPNIVNFEVERKVWEEDGSAWIEVS
jgi:primase-polymerase (primpol)-like protein